MRERVRERGDLKIFSIYFHIPFCLKKCPYCDFYSVPVGNGEVPYQEHLVSIKKQLERDVKEFKLEGRKVETVYFGGGTPSIMPAKFFEDALGSIKKYFKIENDAEISAEVNPGTVNKDWFKGVRGAGVTRISIGVQSFDDGLLRTLGRIHDSNEAMRAIAEAQGENFKSVSVDLMYAISGETIAILENDIKTAMTFQPEHISAYQLTLEDNTPPLVTEDDQLKQMRIVSRMLSRSGWNRYEISNYAKKGFECRHNLNYWRYGEYLGLGAGATSFIDSTRYTQEGDAEKELIDSRTAMGEFCFMGLRTMEGISLANFEGRFGEPFDNVFKGTREKLINDGLLTQTADRIFLTPKGIELSNQVFEMFV